MTGAIVSQALVTIAVGVTAYIVGVNTGKMMAVTTPVPAKK